MMSKIKLFLFWSMVIVVVGGLFGYALKARAGGVFSDTEFYKDVSVGTWAKITTPGYTLTTGGTYTNGAYTNYYRVNGTNELGRLPISAVVTSSWTGVTNSNNTVRVRWPAKDGVKKYIVEFSTNQVLWTNWIVVSVGATNFDDRGTSVWNYTSFTNIYSIMPSPSVPWGSSTPFAGAGTTGPVTSSASDTNNYLKGDGTWSSPMVGAATPWSGYPATNPVDFAQWDATNMGTNYVIKIVLNGTNILGIFVQKWETNIFTVAQYFTGGLFANGTNVPDLLSIVLGSNGVNAAGIAGLQVGSFSHYVIDGLSSNRPDLNIITDGNAATGSVTSIGGQPLVYYWNGAAVSYAVPTNILLTLGSTNVLQMNWIYATPNAILTSTSQPTGEVAIIYKVGLLDGTHVQESLGPTVIQRWTDMVDGPDQRGRMSHIDERIRTLGAKWQSGMAANVRTNVNGAANDDVFVTMDAGVSYQFHKQNLAAVTNVDASASYHILNHPSGVFHITNLNQISVDASGNTVLNSDNSYFNVQVIGFVPSGTTNNVDYKIGLNLSTDDYPTEAEGLADSSAFSVVSVDKDLESIAVWLATLTIRRQAAGSGTWTVINTDRRGFPLFTSGGGSSANAASSVFDDSIFRVFDNGDATKLIAIQASGVSASTTRTITMPDKDITLVGENTANTWALAQTNTEAIYARGGIHMENASDQIMGSGSAIRLFSASATTPIWLEAGLENGNGSSILLLPTNAAAAGDRGDVWISAGAEGGDILFFAGGLVGSVGLGTILDNGNLGAAGNMSPSSGVDSATDIHATLGVTNTPIWHGFSGPSNVTPSAQNQDAFNNAVDAALGSVGGAADNDNFELYIDSRSYFGWLNTGTAGPSTNNAESLVGYSSRNATNHDNASWAGFAIHGSVLQDKDFPTRLPVPGDVKSWGTTGMMIRIRSEQTTTNDHYCVLSMANGTNAWETNFLISATANLYNEYYILRSAFPNDFTNLAAYYFIDDYGGRTTARKRYFSVRATLYSKNSKKISLPEIFCNYNKQQ